MPRRRLINEAGRSVLALQRFDRQDGHRVGFISAMTLLESDDGEANDYLDIGDDHFRNHGFLGDPAGWRLSPMFDVNPNPDVAAQRVTGIGGANGRADEVAGLKAYAGAFGDDSAETSAVLDEVLAATADWRQVAARNGIPPAELERFSPAFEGMRTALAA